MRTLTKEEKEDLKALTEHRWYKLIERLVEDFEIDTLRNLKNVDLTVKKDIEILQKNKYFLQGSEAILRTIKSQTNTIWRKSFD